MTQHHQALSWLQAGQVRISTEAATIEHLAHKFWHRILAMGDLDDDQQLSLEEFQSLMKVIRTTCHGMLCFAVSAAKLYHAPMQPLVQNLRTQQCLDETS